MKTLEELLEESKHLQTLAANLSGEISEMIHAKDVQGKDVDFASILRTADRHPITPHPLDEKDAHTVEAYLTLLLSVAERGTSPDAKDNPLVYPCRIAVALRAASDMELLFKRSLILDEKAVNEALAAVERERLVDFFVLDALRLIELYDRGNLQKVEYVADLAALLNVSKARMNDLLTLLDASLQEHKHIEAFFEEIEFTPFLRYFPFEEYVVGTPSEILAFKKGGLQEDDMLEIMLTSSVRDKKRVSVHNVRLRQKGLMKFSNVKNLEFVNCKFEEFNSGVFDVENCQTLRIQGCHFMHCTRQLDDYPSDGGIISNLKNVEYFESQSCMFSNCYSLFQPMFGGLAEDREYAKLFSGVRAKSIDNYKSSFSNPIC